MQFKLMERRRGFFFRSTDMCIVRLFFPSEIRCISCPFRGRAFPINYNGNDQPIQISFFYSCFRRVKTFLHGFLHT